MFIEENRQQIISPDSVQRVGIRGTANGFVGVQAFAVIFAKNFDSISVQKGAVPILYAIGRQREATAVDIFLPCEAINGSDAPAELYRSAAGRSQAGMLELAAALQMLAGSLERFYPLEKCALTSVRCPSAERLGTTVLHFLSALNGWGQPFYTFYQPWPRPPAFFP